MHYSIQESGLSTAALLNDPTYQQSVANTPIMGGSATCWNKGDPSQTIGIVLSFSGLFGAAYGLYLFFTGVEPLVAGVLIALIAVVVLGIGLSFLLYDDEANKGIEVNSEGIEVVTKKASRKFAWSDIQKVVTMEFQATRLSDPVLLVTLEPKKGKPINFHTGYKGDANVVAEVVLTHCDYIVRNPVAYTKCKA